MIQKDIQPILEEGLERKITSSILIEETPYTYPIKDNVWDNWLPFAYRAFSKIAQRRRDIRSFATIGCGSGADAIGAYYAFPKLETIILSDIDERIAVLAHQNLIQNAPPKNIVALSGSLCAPLRERDLHVDLIYENLPNIPNGAELSLGYRRSSRFAAKESPTNDLIDTYLLRSHADFLQQAHDVLLPGGIAVCSIGGRIPYYIIEKMVKLSGYHCVELVNGFKLQTEPEEVLPGYAQAEKDDVTFNFYRYDKVMDFMARRHEEHLFEVPYYVLDRECISAREALKLYERDNSYKIGHTVHIIGATRK